MGVSQQSDLTAPVSSMLCVTGTGHAVNNTYATVAGRPMVPTPGNNSVNQSDKNEDSEGSFDIPRYHRKKNAAASRSMHIFITKVHRDYSCEQLYDYLIDCGVQVRGLYQRSHMNSSHKSFVVTVPREDFYKVDRQELHDEGIQVREYVEKRGVYQDNGRSRM